MSQSGVGINILSNEVSMANPPSIDAYSRLRVCDPTMLFDAQNIYGIETLKLEAGATGTGVTPVHSASTRMIDLSCGAGSGTSFLQSYQYSPYQPGKSSLILITGNMGAGVSGAVVDIGYFDADNGLIYRQAGAGGLQFVRRTSTSGSVVEDVVPQASWNLDPMDGTGPLGIVLDPTTVFILVIDLQYLGMGRIRFGFDIGGKIVYAHEFLNANVITVPIMQSASLPAGMQVTATASVASKTAHFKCVAVISEGGSKPGVGMSLSTPEGVATAAGGSRTHLISLRPRATFGGLVNRTCPSFKFLSLCVTGNNPVFWELCAGATFTVGPSYVDVNTAHSSSEYGTGGTFSSLAGGIVLASGYVASKGAVRESLAFDYPFTLDRGGAVRALGTLSLLVTGVTGNSGVRASIEIEEIR